MDINTTSFKDYYDLVYLGTQDNSVYYNRVPNTFSLENSELNEYYNEAASDIDKLEKKLKLYCFDLELAVLFIHFTFGMQESALLILLTVP